MLSILKVHEREGKVNGKDFYVRERATSGLYFYYNVSDVSSDDPFTASNPIRNQIDRDIARTRNQIDANISRTRSQIDQSFARATPMGATSMDRSSAMGRLTAMSSRVNPVTNDDQVEQVFVVGLNCSHCRGRFQCKRMKCTVCPEYYLCLHCPKANHQHQLVR